MAANSNSWQLTRLKALFTTEEVLRKGLYTDKMYSVVTKRGEAKTLAEADYANEAESLAGADYVNAAGWYFKTLAAQEAGESNVLMALYGRQGCNSIDILIIPESGPTWPKQVMLGVWRHVQTCSALVLKLSQSMAHFCATFCAQNLKYQLNSTPGQRHGGVYRLPPLLRHRLRTVLTDKAAGERDREAGAKTNSLHGIGHWTLLAASPPEEKSLSIGQILCECDTGPISLGRTFLSG